jgi:carbon-monoxide dehydrogenase small subunit
LKKEISIKVNGETYNTEVEPRTLLVDFLRETLGLTGTKVGCGMGECGSCTVIVNGKAVNSCLMLVTDVSGKEVLTIEGLYQDANKLHTIQESFIENGAIQCGFCTPGMILAAKALLDASPNPSIAEIKDAIAGNICRCTGYKKIVDAISCASSHSNTINHNENRK